MENQLTATNRINGHIQSLRGFHQGGVVGTAPGAVPGRRQGPWRQYGQLHHDNGITRAIGSFDAFTDRVASDLRAAGARVRGKIERDGVGPTLQQAARGIGNDMKEDMSGLARRARDLGSNLGQTTGEIADRIGSSEVRKEPFSTLAGLAASGLRRAGFYNPVARDAAATRGKAFE